MVGGLEGKASAVSRMHFPKVTLIVAGSPYSGNNYTVSGQGQRQKQRAQTLTPVCREEAHTAPAGPSEPVREPWSPCAASPLGTEPVEMGLRTRCSHVDY